MYCIVCTVCTTLAHQPCVHFWFGIAEHCNKCGNKGNPLAPKGGPGALKGRPEAPKGDQKTTRGQLQRQQYTCKNSMFDPTEIDSISVGKTPLSYYTKNTQKVTQMCVKITQMAPWETPFGAECTNFRNVSSNMELFGEYSWWWGEGPLPGPLGARMILVCLIFSGLCLVRRGFV